MTLAAAIKSTCYGGAVTCCGLVGSVELPLNVYPFILRGVSLFGIDSAQAPREMRLQVWDKLAGPWKPAHLEEVVTEVGLEGLEEKIQAIGENLKAEQDGLRLAQTLVRENQARVRAGTLPPVAQNNYDLACVVARSPIPIGEVIPDRFWQTVSRPIEINGP